MNKKEKTDKCRAILNSYSIGDRLIPDHFDFMCRIFSSHPQWEFKKGVGISHITVQSTEFNAKCFCIYRTDGSCADVSFTHSIKSWTKKTEIQLACRHAIRKTIQNFKATSNNGTVLYCPFTEERLTPQNTHVDHYDLTFAELFEIWIKNHDEKEVYNKIVKTSDSQRETYFTDEAIILDFIQFHNENTHLRVISQTANLSLLKK